ncbi:MAG: chemotaxis protein CheW [Actinomycetota bacterium]
MKTTTFSDPKSYLKNSQQFLLFTQKDNLFAVELASVREVLCLSEELIAPVPNTLPFLLGLINLRGEILVVADFGRFITLDPVDSHHPQSRILLVEAPDPRDVRLPVMRMGLAVSRVEGVLTLNPERIVSAVEVSPELAPFLKGLYNSDGRLLMVVDVEAIAHSKRW